MFEDAIYTLNKKIKKYIVKNKIPVREIDKGSPTWSGYCIVTSRDKEIVINNKQSIFIKPFTTLHEIGHFFDENYANVSGIGVIKDFNLEKTADNYIYTFCRKRCSIIELFLLKKIIENTSKMSIEFSIFEKLCISVLKKVGRV